MHRILAWEIEMSSMECIELGCIDHQTRDNKTACVKRYQPWSMKKANNLIENGVIDTLTPSKARGTR